MNWLSFRIIFKQVGIAAVQLAKAHGLYVIGTASTEQGLQAVLDQGADLVFNHKKEGYLKDIAV
jgi:NADPH2:quinone reductase